MSCKPNFFLIGAPKSGTTALSEYLRLHPNVFFSHPKEPDYFAADFKGRTIYRESDYLRLFQDADPSRHLAIGEGSVVYMFSKIAVSNILQFQPNARLIVMLRNPVDLVVSLHAQVLVEGNDNIPSFLEAWNAEAERHEGRRIPVGSKDPQWLYYSEWGKLGSQLKRTLEIVPREHLKIILFDDFIRDTRSVYLEVLEFLGLPDDGRTQFPKINERRAVKYQFLQDIVGSAMRFWLPWRARLTLGKGFGLGSYLNKLNTTTEKKSHIPVATRQMLVDFYKEDVLLLESLLDRNLEHWRNTHE